MIFSEAGDPSEIIFQIPRAFFVKTMDCGLITKKLRGFFAKMPGNIELLEPWATVPLGLTSIS
jgi:hypothetical protein